jgi:hypothetical protein
MAVTRRNHKPDEDENPDPGLDISKIKDCIKLMDEHELTGFELEQQGFKVKLKRGGVASPALPPADTPQEPAAEAIICREN